MGKPEWGLEVQEPKSRSRASPQRQSGLHDAAGIEAGEGKVPPGNRYDSRDDVQPAVDPGTCSDL